MTRWHTSAWKSRSPTIAEDPIWTANRQAAQKGRWPLTSAAMMRRHHPTINPAPDFRIKPLALFWISSGLTISEVDA
jgi:hypothetical protein